VILINDIESGNGNPRRNRDTYRFLIWVFHLGEQLPF
jgi:hypothetical protein